VRWLEPATWHLTLLFLGSVPVARAAELVSLADQVGRANRAFDVTIDGGGGLVRQQDAVAWLAVQDGAGEVIRMADQLLTACPPDVTAGAPPRRTASAHLTVARRAGPELVEALARQRHGRLVAGWSVGRLALVRSHLGREGAHYETLHEATLYAADE